MTLRGEQAWPIVSVGEEAFDDATPGPTALTEGDLSALLEQYRAATRRAIVAGFDVLEIHAAHGYLLHSFLSPLSNKRGDGYGGSIENRMRFPLAVVEAVRAEWPADKPLFVRISAVDGVDIGWTIEDLVKFAKALAARGIDLVDCSTGGMKLPRDKSLVARTPGFQVPFAAKIRKEAQVATMAVGLILERSRPKRSCNPARPTSWRWRGKCWPTPTSPPRRPSSSKVHPAGISGRISFAIGSSGAPRRCGAKGGRKA